MLTVRKYHPNDSALIASWYEKRNYLNIGPILPPDGFVAEDENGPIACVWVYKSVPLGFLEFAVTRPEKTISALKGLKLCIDAAKKFVIDEGMVGLFQFIPDQRLVKYYENHCDFKATEQATLMVWGRTE